MEPDRLARLVADPAPHLNDPDASVRRLAVSVCTPRIGEPAIVTALTGLLSDDPDPRVRAEAAETLGSTPDALEPLLQATGDGEPVVREAVATALGEIADSAALAWLIGAVTGDNDRLVQEAAVAALGAIGDPAALPILLVAVSKGGPQVRRRAVAALTVFDGPEVETAIREAAHDRNPMVREAAEMVVGRPATWEPIQLNDPPPG